MDQKIILFSVDCILNKNTNTCFDNIKDELKKINEDGNIICIFSKNRDKLNSVKDLLPFVKIYDRKKLKIFLKKQVKDEEKSYFIVVGHKDHDFYLATNFKLLYITPGWVEKQEEKAKKYGLPVDKPSKLIKLIKILKNQNLWFYELEVDSKTKVYSLTSANTFGNNHTTEELELVNGFREVLKKGDYRYSKVLLFHFLASIIHNTEFRKIQDWGVFPSSGIDVNEDLLNFKEKARYMMNGKKNEPIFIRHTATKKSHFIKDNTRLPCDRHFKTIKLNDYYKGCLKGRVVCIIDDYLTNGTSFETARNLLLKEGVEKIYFISLGKFKKNGNKDYLKQNYNIEGDISKEDYSWKSLSEEWLSGKFNNDAINEIKNLYRILYDNQNDLISIDL